jgi:hypothetical protein
VELYFYLHAIELPVVLCDPSSLVMYDYGRFVGPTKIERIIQFCELESVVNGNL